MAEPTEDVKRDVREFLGEKPDYLQPDNYNIEDAPGAEFFSKAMDNNVAWLQRYWARLTTPQRLQFRWWFRKLQSRAKKPKAWSHVITRNIREGNFDAMAVVVFRNTWPQRCMSLMVKQAIRQKFPGEPVFANAWYGTGSVGEGDPQTEAQGIAMPSVSIALPSSPAPAEAITQPSSSAPAETTNPSLDLPGPVAQATMNLASVTQGQSSMQGVQSDSNTESHYALTTTDTVSPADDTDAPADIDAPTDTDDAENVEAPEEDGTAANDVRTVEALSKRLGDLEAKVNELKTVNEAQARKIGEQEVAIDSLWDAILSKGRLINEMVDHIGFVLDLISRG